VEWSVGFDVVLLRREEEVEPLHATYRRTCLLPIEEAIRAGRQRIISFFDRVRVRYLMPEEVIPLDPELRSFFNVNTPEEWERAQLML